jgi:hypothetical protein
MPDASTLLGVKMNHKMPPIPQPILQLMETQRVYIYNVGPKQHNIPLSLGNFIIPGCPEGQEYSEPVKFMGRAGIPALVPQSVVTNVDGTHVDHDWDTKMEGKDLVKDILGFGENDRRRYGVFLAAGRTPTPEEIATANGRLEEFYSKLVAEADASFEINGGQEIAENGRSVSSITPDHITACKSLGLDRPWTRKSQKQVVCDECGTGNLPTTAFCKQCDNMLNAEAAQRKFPAKYAERMGPTEPVATPEVPAKRAYTRRTEVA